MLASPMYDYVRSLTRTEVQLETLAVGVVEVLTARFGQVSPEIAAAVAVTADIQRLHHLLRAASLVESPEQFAQNLPQPVLN
jgi:hypothetical protein